MSELWPDWFEIKKNAEGRNVYFYGRSEDWVHKAIRGYGDKVIGIIDREETYHGHTYFDLPILPIEDIDRSVNPYFIITAGDFDGIIDALSDLGYEAGKDFACSPDFRDYKILEEIRSTRVSLLLASSDYNDRTRARSSELGGGLFILDTESQYLQRKIIGSFRQFVKISCDLWAAVEYVEKAILVFDYEFNVVKRFELDLPNYCGIAFDSNTNMCWILNAGTDEIIGVSMTQFKEVYRRKFSIRSIGAGHHINDATFHEDKLYLSYFSLSGSFKNEVFDGGVASIDPYYDEVPLPVIEGLWKPHSPKFFDGKLYALDSMRGQLVSGRSERLPKFSGFVRGMDKLDNKVFVGQSADMYLTERMATETVLLNAGVHVCDVKYNATRFIDLPGMMNIHEVGLWV